MSRQEIKLTAQQDSASVNLPWVADGLTILNSSPFTLLVRIGGNDLPNFGNADFAVYAGSSISLPVSTRDFGLTLAVPAVQTTLVGMPCFVRFSVDEVLGNFGQANWRSTFNNAFSIVGAATVQFDVNAAGANGLALNIQQTNATDGIIVEIQTSANGINYQRFRRYRVTQQAILSRVFPVTLDNYRVILTNVNTGQTSNGVFGYSLLTYYSSIPPVYKTIVQSGYAANFAGGATLTGTTVFGTYTLEEITLYIQSVASIPNDLDIGIAVFTDGIRGGDYHIKMPPAAIANEAKTLQIESAIAELEHRRLNQWGFRIKSDWSGVSDLRVDIINYDNPANTCTELRLGLKVKVEA